MKKLIKAVGMLVLTITMTLFFGFSSMAGQWIPEPAGFKWQEDNGVCLVNAWKEIGGRIYYFGNDGYMMTNTWIGNYYVGADGAMLVNAITPDGQQVEPDGARILKKSGEIAEVVDVKVLGNGYFMTQTPDDMYVAQNDLKGAYDYYDKNFNYRFSIPRYINGRMISSVTGFMDGIALSISPSEYGYGVYYYNAYDGAGNCVYDLNVISDLYRFMPGQDPYGMTLFAWANHTDALRFICYSCATGFIERVYYYSDYPMLEKVNKVIGFENGKANLVCETEVYVENEGRIGQKVYCTYENIASVDTLGIISNPVKLIEGEENVPILLLTGEKNVVDFGTKANYSTELGESGAYNRNSRRNSKSRRSSKSRRNSKCRTTARSGRNTAGVKTKFSNWV